MIIIMGNTQSQSADYLPPGVTADGCWNKEMPVPWKESFDVVELGL